MLFALIELKQKCRHSGAAESRTRNPATHSKYWIPDNRAAVSGMTSGVIFSFHINNGIHVSLHQKTA
jgi:hypothetical protein